MPVFAISTLRCNDTIQGNFHFLIALGIFCNILSIYIFYLIFYSAFPSNVKGKLKGWNLQLSRFDKFYFSQSCSNEKFNKKIRTLKDSANLLQRNAFRDPPGCFLPGILFMLHVASADAIHIAIRV